MCTYINAYTQARAHSFYQPDDCWTNNEFVFVLRFQNIHTDRPVLLLIETISCVNWARSNKKISYAAYEQTETEEEEEQR